MTVVTETTGEPQEYFLWLSPDGKELALVNHNHLRIALASHRLKIRLRFLGRDPDTSLCVFGSTATDAPRSLPKTPLPLSVASAAGPDGVPFNLLGR